MSAWDAAHAPPEEKQRRAEELIRERREDEIRAELREKIAAGMEGQGCNCRAFYDERGKGGFRQNSPILFCGDGALTGDGDSHYPDCPESLAARIRAGEFG